MVARLHFGSDGITPTNEASMTLAQEIGWHRVQIKNLESLGINATTTKGIAAHRAEIARLLAQQST